MISVGQIGLMCAGIVWIEAVLFFIWFSALEKSVFLRLCIVFCGFAVLSVVSGVVLENNPAVLLADALLLLVPMFAALAFRNILNESRKAAEG